MNYFVIKYASTEKLKSSLEYELSHLNRFKEYTYKVENGLPIEDWEYLVEKLDCQEGWTLNHIENFIVDIQTELINRGGVNIRDNYYD